jgi:ankyrin repeat protein
VFCQLEMLRNCLPKNVRRILRELPASLDETYERMLREILEVNADDVYRLLQCIAVSTRPLGVDELAEVLALNFDAASEGIPALDEDLRSGDEEQDVLSACSSLIAVVNDTWGDRVVQFAHFSVKEFLTSDRLANLKPDISRFHIRLEPAHTVIAQVSLAILLQTDYDDTVQRTHPFPYGDQNISPLFHYATENWVGHAHFGNVSSRVEHGMRRLFDPTKPNFAAWLKSGYRDNEWRSFRRGEYYGMWYSGRHDLISLSEDDAPLCLYYAALCGFPDLTKHLIAMYPRHINAMVGENESPLVAALYNRHFQVAELLHQHGAVLPIGHEGRTLLHSASGDGLVDVTQWLLNIGADANAQEDGHRTPLHFAAAKGHLEIFRILLERGGDINAAAGEDNRTPLHEASQGGHIDVVRLLIQNGADARTDFQNLFLLASSSRSVDTIQFFFQLVADVNARYESHQTLLHLVSSEWGDEAAKLLIEHGADVHARDQSQSTPLHLTSSEGDTETAKLLIKHGADVNSRDQSQSTSLHVASSRGGAYIARLLIEHGADVHAQDQRHSTPLHLTSSIGDAELETSLLLIEHGADVNTRDESHQTALHLASSVRKERGRETVRILLEHGADVNAQDKSESTSLHLAVSEWNTEVARLLIKHRADVNTQDQSQSTPLHIVSSSWALNDIARLLVEHGADVNIRDGSHQTALHLASSTWKGSEIVQILLNHGADVHARDQGQSTPLHLASRQDAETVRLLIEHGADVDARNQSQSTPLHLTSSSNFVNADIARVLIEHGADVCARDKGQSTPLHIVSSVSFEIPVPHLYANDENDETPLHEVSYWVPDAYLRVLLENGADVDAEDDEGQTPFQIASSKGYHEMAQFLIDHRSCIVSKTM